MNQGTLFSGQPILAQLLQLIPRPLVQSLVATFDTDRYYKKFKSYDHLVAMLYTIFNRCTSLREVVTGLLACQNRLYHLGVTYTPRRSTLADANCKRDHRLFEGIYKRLYRRYAWLLPDSRTRTDWSSRLFIVDSTTISLFQQILTCAGRTPMNGKRKGGVKAHTMIQADEDVPALVCLTSGATHDSTFMKQLDLPQGSIVVFDKGYVDYSIYEQWTQKGVTYVTRLRKSAVYEVLNIRTVRQTARQKGVISDTLVLLGRSHHHRLTRTKARLIVYYDAKKGRTFTFVTNNLRLSAYTIAQIYKRRWQIEGLFKRIKQNYPLKYFLGDNENAIKIQIWCALIADLLLKVIGKLTQRKWSFANLASMVRLHLMTYINLVSFLNNPEKALLKVQQRSVTDPTWSLFPT